ncbi:endonuclease/exonuclease/phosphatase family protein [Ruegeria sp.]|uniref:endonuclease/exonuclease/phosphatase family protein n=1 Tax=Ruegeria sp. TaxID=1879320 RepID=UPI003C7C8C5F
MQVLTNKRLVRILIRGCSCILIGLAIFGFTGHFFSAGDSIALLRLQIGVLLAVFTFGLFLIRAKYLAPTALATAAIAIGSIALGFTAPSEDCNGSCLTLYQKNLMSRAWPRYSLADDIITMNADIVTLQEVSDHNRKFMANMYAHYQNKVSCRFRTYQDVAVLTNLPVVEGSEFCLTGYGVAGLQVVAPEGEAVWVVSVHLKWPFPFEQSAQSRRIAERIAELDGPVLIAGDFNMVPWGASVKRIASAAENEVFGTVENTHHLGRWSLPLSIDNLLFPKGTVGTVELRPYLGSDHLGKFARFRLQ